jgi:hypothetical protein
MTIGAATARPSDNGTVIPGMNAIAFRLRRASKDGVQRSACSHPSRRARKCAHLRMTVFVLRCRSLILPDGQITFAHQNLSSPLCKNISVSIEGKSPAY